VVLKFEALFIVKAKLWATWWLRQSLELAAGSLLLARSLALRFLSSSCEGVLLHVIHLCFKALVLDLHPIEPVFQKNLVFLKLCVYVLDILVGYLAHHVQVFITC